MEFLHSGTDDPRPGFLEALVEACNKRGSIVVYNQAFEAGVNNKLALNFPAYAGRLEKINNRSPKISQHNPFALKSKKYSFSPFRPQLVQFNSYLTTSKQNPNSMIKRMIV